MKATHTIGAVVKKTGLSSHLIRIWERRYGAVQPIRTETNRRLYTDEDIEKLRLLKRATESGESIGQIASFSLKELEDLVGVELPPFDLPADNNQVTTVSLLKPEEYLEKCIIAARNMDTNRLSALLLQALVNFSRPVTLEEIVRPLLYAVGTMWHRGEIKVAHEHAVSSVIRTFLGNIIMESRYSPSAPGLIAATPSGQMHEFGAMLAAAGATIDGWNVTYLGPDCPAEDITGAVNLKKARAVILSIVYPGDDPHLEAELVKLRNMLGNDIHIFVGGGVSGEYQDILRKIKAIRVDNLNELRLNLSKIRLYKKSNHS